MTTDNLKFVRLAHLGKSDRAADQDQRLAVDQHGNYYLFDWSGSRPDLTDDGPLRVITEEPITLHVSHHDVWARVSVYCMRDMSRSGCSVSIAGLVKMFEIMRGRGDEVPEVEHDSDSIEAILTLKPKRTYRK